MELVAAGLTTDFALSARDAIRRALAAVLTAAREDIARAVKAEAGCLDPPCGGCGWCESARVVLAWPGEVLYGRTGG